MRTVRRLRLRCFSFNIYSDVLSTLLLFALSNLGQAHQKHTIPARALRGFFHLGQLCVYGGPGGIRTPVQNTFLFASYNNSINNYIRIYLVCQVVFTNVPICHSEVILFFLNENLR